MHVESLPYNECGHTNIEKNGPTTLKKIAPPPTAINCSPQL